MSTKEDLQMAYDEGAFDAVILPCSLAMGPASEGVDACAFAKYGAHGH